MHAVAFLTQNQHQSCAPVWVMVNQKIWSSMSYANCRPSSDILCKIITTHFAVPVRVIINQKTWTSMSDANCRPRSDILCETINSKIAPEFRVILNQMTWNKMSDANCRPRSDILCKKNQTFVSYYHAKLQRYLIIHHSEDVPVVMTLDSLWSKEQRHSKIPYRSWKILKTLILLLVGCTRRDMGSKISYRSWKIWYYY